MEKDAGQQGREESGHPAQSRLRRWLGALVVGLATLSLVALAAGSLSSLFQVDRIGLGMFLTYSPRICWLGLGALLLVFYLVRRRWWLSLLVVLFCCLLAYDSPWGGGAKPVSNDTELLTLLAFNTHYASSEDVAQLCAKHSVDLLSLQEVQAGDVASYQETLSDFVFFVGDRNAEFEFKAKYVFTCVVGIRRDLLADPSSVEVFTGITGYRTLAARAELLTGPLYLVNVHTTKPVAPEFGLTRVMVEQTAIKSRRHRDERDQLAQWIESVREQEPSVPTLIAGDFNAPGNTGNLRLAGFKNAQRESGRGLHLTFPARLPIFGIDHVLGSGSIEFVSYEVLNTGISDHCAQLARFQLAN